MFAETEDHALPIGGMIEEFRIVRVLGTGSFGVVYQGENTYLDETVAIKEFLPTDLARRMPNGRIEPLSATTNEAFGWARERFLQEAKTLWGLARPTPHRNIVRVTRYRELNGSAYMFMEFEHGRPFSELLEERGALSFQELRDIIEPLLSGLARVHSGGILHRDIKPANILIRSDGSPVLIDFGSAKYLAKGGERSVFATFTPLYAALEQHQEAGEQGPWTDIYGLGATLYRAVTGMAPKSASQRLLSDPQSPALEACRGRFPEEFLKAIDHACELNPAKRPQRVQEWRDELLGEGSADAFAPTVVRSPGRARGPGASAPPAAGIPDARNEPGSTEARADGKGRQRTVEPPGQTARSPRATAMVVGALVVASLLGGGWYLLQKGSSEGTAGGLGIELPVAAPDRASTAANYERLAIEHFQRNELERSVNLIELGLRATPGDQRLLKLRGYFAKHVAARETLEQASQAASDEDFDRSLSLIDDGLQQLPEHAGLLALQKRVERLRAEQRQAQAADLFREAEERLQGGDLDASAALIEQGLRLAPDDGDLLSLRSSLNAERRRRAEVESVITDVRALLAKDELEGAQRRLSRGLALTSQDPALLALHQALEAEQKARFEGGVARIRSAVQEALRRGDPDEALDLIDGAPDAQRQSPTLKALRSQVVAARDRQRAERLRKMALDAQERGDLVESLRLAKEGLGLAPGNSSLEGLRVELEAALKQRTNLAQVLAAARELRREGALDDSLMEIERGLALAPEHAELLELRTSVRREQQARQEETVAGLIDLARRRQEAGELEQAVIPVEEGLRLMPEHPQLLTLRDELQQVIDLRDQVEEILPSCESLLDGEEPSLADLTQAGTCYRRALSLAPEEPRATQGVTRVADALAGSAAGALERRDAQAVDAATAALEELYPNHAALDALRHDRELLERQLLPELAMIEGGCYRMGSPADEVGREQDEKAQEVCVESFLLAKREVSVADFQRFIEATGYRTDAERGIGGQEGCWAFDRDNGTERWGYHAWAQWRQPNKYQKQVPDHPVSCVSWNDANAYIAWLNDQTGREYRLPTEAEWEYAARAGTSSARYWLERPQPNACRYASVADAEHGWDNGFPCGDGNEWVAPVSAFAANPWGLHDMLGNLWEWTCSDYSERYSGSENRCVSPESDAPRVLRGGAWNSGPAIVRAAYRNRNYPEARFSIVGFRIARSAEPERGEVVASGPPQGGTGPKETGPDRPKR